MNRPLLEGLRWPVLQSPKPSADELAWVKPNGMTLLLPMTVVKRLRAFFPVQLVVGRGISPTKLREYLSKGDDT